MPTDLSEGARDTASYSHEKQTYHFSPSLRTAQVLIVPGQRRCILALTGPTLESVTLLRAGDLLWIRAPDRHTLFVRPGQKMYFINIAFRQEVWEDFRRVALGGSPAPWEAADEPPGVHVPPARRGECAEAFQTALQAFHARPSPLDLCRFWCAVLPLLGPTDGVSGPEPADAALLNSPAWLAHALLAMRREAAVYQGLPYLVHRCGVSPAHLARTLKAQAGQTPTEFVNSLRLEQAAVLLATTPQEIAGGRPVRHR